MRWISEHREQFKISRMAVLLDVSKSGVYSYLRRQPSKRSQANAFLLTKIREIHQRGRKCYGSPRITAALRQQGFQAGHNRVSAELRLLATTEPLQPETAVLGETLSRMEALVVGDALWLLTRNESLQPRTAPLGAITTEDSRSGDSTARQP